MAGSDGPASIVDVDNGSVRVLHLGPLTHRSVWGPTLTLYALTGSSGAALAVVTRQPCGRCAIAQEQFSIATSGAVKQIATRYFAQPTTQTTQVPGSASEWVLTRRGTGRCSLRLVPSPHPAVAVPCGDVGPAFPDGLALWTENDQRGIVLNPYTGVVRDHLRAAYEFQPVGHNLAIESSPEPNPAALSLVNLATGHRLRLGWPSILHFGYQVLPEPHGPLVAIQFADPAYPPPPQQTIAQASDLWLLNTQTGKLTHLPSFPILTYLKASGIAWTSDGHLIIAAAGGHRTAIAVWRPGQHTLSVRTIPALHGYAQMVPLTG